MLEDVGEEDQAPGEYDDSELEIGDDYDGEDWSVCILRLIAS